jgi:myosin heavy subunit
VSNTEDKNLDDANNFKIVMNAMNTIEIPRDEQDELIDIIASVLHLGNITFGVGEAGHSTVYENEAVHAFAKVLGIELEQVKRCLTHRTIDANGDLVTSPLDRDQSFYARDALAKAMYARVFDWLVETINKSIHTPTCVSRSKTNHVLGILDIYGFEVMETNAFEQVCAVITTRIICDLMTVIALLLVVHKFLQ